MSPSLRNSLMLIVSFACVFLVARTEAKIYKDCGSILSKISTVTVSGCHAQPCVLQRGSTTNVSISFIPRYKLTKLEMDVWGIIRGVPISFKLPNPDGCTKSGLTCPLQPNRRATYHAQLYIHKYYPRMQLITKWKMVDKERSPSSVLCFEMGVKLQ